MSIFEWSTPKNTARVIEKGAAVETLERPAARPPIKSSRPAPAPVEPMREAALAEYAQLAAALGVMPPDLAVEKFKAFLEHFDIPTYSLPVVIEHMDKKAAAESKEQAGWCWRPLREKDHRPGVTFGRQAVREQDTYGRRSGKVSVPASDYYRGYTSQTWTDERGVERVHRIEGSGTPYDRTVPIHALRKAALIDKEFGGAVGLFVSDYALAPAIQVPDPFLMAVVGNETVPNGTNRFVIDFWDEPGFGIAQMLAK